MRQAVDNLLANALRLTGSGGRVQVTACSERDGTTIGVRDTGPGFDPAFLPLAFERFSRPDRARNESAGGSGLGLAIVQAVAEAHGGSASATNLEGGGACVSMWFPG